MHARSQGDAQGKLKDSTGRAYTCKTNLNRRRLRDWVLKHDGRPIPPVAHNKEVLQHSTPASGAVERDQHARTIPNAPLHVSPTVHQALLT